MSYVLITDSAANLSYEYVKKHNIHVLSLKYYIGEEEFEGFVETKSDNWIKQFYGKLRNKETVTTSCVNAEQFEALFSSYADKGMDFLYLAFSSALSATCDIAYKTCEEMKERYPDRKMHVIDSRAASLGQGMFVHYLVKNRDEGMGVDELAEWAMDNRENMCHWFTVDDLFFLKRGGRVSATTAIAGTVLGIKPVMHVDDEGRLINVAKARGRRASIDMMVDKMAEHIIDPEKQTIFIGHGDCIEDVKYLQKKIRERFGIKDFVDNFVNPVIGAHSGPGTLALFFYGDKK